MNLAKAKEPSVLTRAHSTALAPRPSAIPAGRVTIDARPGSLAPTPRTATEQYWAARALTAETLLSARTSHHHELRSLAYTEESKRAKELAALTRAHEARYAKLEKLVTALLLALLGLFMLTVYLLTHPRIHRPPPSRWLPSHFTVPILSPFTSVVEHESSVVGTKTIVIVSFMLIGMIYLLIQHRWR